MISARLVLRCHAAIALVKRNVCVAPQRQVEHRLMLLSGYTLILTSRLGCATRIHDGGIAYNRVICYTEAAMILRHVLVESGAAELCDLGARS
jgi:hypothetical protein